MKSILINFATRSRPEKFRKCLANIKAHALHPYRIIASVDDDDTSMLNFDYPAEVTVMPGVSKNKIEAINRSVQAYKEPWDILINTSDDMWFAYPGFDQAIRDAFETNFPDMDGVLHFNDGNQKDNCMTMSIIGRKYYERDGYVYHPSYISLWCDKEAEEVAKLRGRYRYMGHHLVLFNHNHPAWGLAAYDAQYEQTESQAVNRLDHQTYLSRKEKNFYIA